jgi:hypothetical protein
MPKADKRKSKKARHAEEEARARHTERSIRGIERRIDALQREQRAVNRRLKKLAKRLAAPPRSAASPSPWERSGPPGGRRGKGGPPPWARGLGPVVSLDVPLETDDPAAPLWASVSARLPEDIDVVSDDGVVARYRYSPVGSTPQAPRYRLVKHPGPDGPERNPD